VTDDERAELVDLAESYRQLFAAIIHRAVLDYRVKKYRAEVTNFFKSGAADPLFYALDIAPDEFRRRLFGGLVRLTTYEYASSRPSSTPFDDTED
jgi:hypothetical protein